ncbi:hypothetical protein [Hufsiella ginkgonis]|uniref:Uncharacterized protein n=1 Tax=Hufsiella ginkgonis TaxID=2695274 RepID=A0A7K1XYY2_9SPHI|nr:hypothetical protein [Hufsiella ginkgonis]MXV16038.1 hypothetical protein [Hufsiella ginkgonis]
MEKKNSFSFIMAGILFTAFLSPASAQKLPDNQEVGIRAPQAVKIDGKASEWGTLQAFNKNTEVAYTVANDDSTLYLVVQSTVGNVISKITGGGITFSINTEGKKKEKDAVSVTFPVIAPPKPVAETAVAGGRSGAPLTVVGGGMSAGPGMNAAALKKRKDSIMFVNTNKKIDKFKDVQVLGIPAIKDTLLSIYNEEGIKTRCTYEESGLYTYELAIPLKYLAINIRNPKEFLFNLRLNGINLGAPSSGGSISIVSTNGGGGDFQAMFSPTDFWGKYLVVAK